jgi:ATP-dependent DNA ligase
MCQYELSSGARKVSARPSIRARGGRMPPGSARGLAGVDVRQALGPRAAPPRCQRPHVTLIVFDALPVGGADLRAAPWSKRRARLGELLGGAGGAVRLTPVLELNPALHAALVADGWEVTVAKRTSGRYRCGHRSNAWVKLKSLAARDRDRRRFVSSIAA